jgi:hypothetical protein
MKEGVSTMANRVLNIDDSQIVSGTGMMAPGEGGGHTRLLWASVPAFASRPDITISIYSDDDVPPVPQPENFNPGVAFTPWAIQYVPQAGVDGMDLIAISAVNINIGQDTPVRVMCSYLAIGEKG